MLLDIGSSSDAFCNREVVLMNPVTLFQNCEVSREVVRRLIAPGVRYIADISSLGGQMGCGFAVLSFIAPAVEFD